MSASLGYERGVVVYREALDAVYGYGRKVEEMKRGVERVGELAREKKGVAEGFCDEKGLERRLRDVVGAGRVGVGVVGEFGDVERKVGRMEEKVEAMREEVEQILRNEASDVEGRVQLAQGAVIVLDKKLEQVKEVLEEVEDTRRRIERGGEKGLGEEGEVGDIVQKIDELLDAVGVD